MASKARDRTEDLKDAAHRSAVSLGFSEAKIAAILASFILHKHRERTPFMKAALNTLEHIKALEQYLMKHRKDYVDLRRTTEQERDSIEHEVSLFIKACKDQIDVLNNSIKDEEANSRRWLGAKASKTNVDTIAHKHGVVLILSEKLHSVTSTFDKLRAVRFQDAINRVTPRIKMRKIGKGDEAGVSKESFRGPGETYDTQDRDSVEAQPGPVRVQKQLLDDETRILQVELSGLMDAAQEIEKKMIEMSALNHLMSTHVLQQAQQIELLYDQAVEATNNVELGNKELSQAIQRNSSSRTFLILFFFVLTFSILFLDWYS